MIYIVITYKLLAIVTYLSVRVNTHYHIYKDCQESPGRKLLIGEVIAE